MRSNYSGLEKCVLNRTCRLLFPQVKQSGAKVVLPGEFEKNKQIQNKKTHPPRTLPQAYA